MSLKYGWGASAVLLTFWATAVWAGVPTDGALCDAGGCATCGCATGTCPTGGCHSEWCCPKYCFTIEKPPKIKYARVCPRPVCNPCEIEGYGYYPTCWRPWAYPPNYEHCPVPPPGVLASQPLPLIVGPGAAGSSHDEALPPPHKTANPNPNR